MLIDIALGCQVWNESGRSECSLLLESLIKYRGYVEQNGELYGVATEGITE